MTINRYKITIYKIIFFCFTLFIFSICNARAEDNNNKYKLSVEYNYFYFMPSSYNLYGLNFEIFITNSISLNYSAYLGVSNDKVTVHTDAGIAAAILLAANELENNDDNEDYSYDGLAYTAFFLSLIPEGINFYIPSSDERLTLIPFINPLGFEYFNKEYTLTSSLGIKVQYELNPNLFIFPKTELRYLYKENKLSYILGLGLGFKL